MSTLYVSAKRKACVHAFCYILYVLCCRCLMFLFLLCTLFSLLLFFIFFLYFIIIIIIVHILMFGVYISNAVYGFIWCVHSLHGRDGMEKMCEFEARAKHSPYAAHTVRQQSGSSSRMFGASNTFCGVAVCKNQREQK